MPVYWFRWDEVNEAHVLQHGVSCEEVEEVISDPDFTGRSSSSGRPVAEGYISTGRYLLCIYEVLAGGDIYPVTASDVDRK